MHALKNGTPIPVATNPQPVAHTGFYIQAAAPDLRRAVNGFLALRGRDALIDLFRQAEIDCDSREFFVALTARQQGDSVVPALVHDFAYAVNASGPCVTCQFSTGRDRFRLEISLARHASLQTEDIVDRLAAASQQLYAPDEDEPDEPDEPDGGAFAAGLLTPVPQAARTTAADAQAVASAFTRVEEIDRELTDVHARITEYQQVERRLLAELDVVRKTLDPERLQKIRALLEERRAAAV